MSRHILTFLLLFIVSTISAQTIQESEITYVNGFAKKIAGSDFNYHSSISIARDCLLARATDGTSSVEWQSSPIPRQFGIYPKLNACKLYDLQAFPFFAYQYQLNNFSVNEN